MDLSKLSNEELLGMIQQSSNAPPNEPNAPPKTSVTDDVIKSAATAPLRASSALVGLPQAALSAANQYRVSHPTGAPKDFMQLGNEKLMDLISKIPNLGDLASKGFDQISQILTGGDVYKPQTAPGRVADFTAQAMVGPGSTTQKLVSGLSGGTAGEAVRGVTDDPRAVAGAQMAGSVLSSLPFMIRRTAGATAQEGLKNVSPDEAIAAQKLMDEAVRRGTKISGAEALAKIKGESPLLAAQRVAEQAPGGQSLREMMASRAANNQIAFESEANRRLGRLPVNQQQTPVDLASAGDEAVNAVKKARTAKTSKYWTAQEGVDERKIVNAIKSQDLQDDLMKAKDEATDAWGKARSMYRYAETQKNKADAFRGGLDNKENYDLVDIWNAENNALPHMDRSWRAEASGDAAKVAAKNAEFQAKLLQSRIGRLADNDAPIVQKAINGIVADIDKKLMTAGPEEAAILRKFKGQIAPGGEALKYPTTVESVYQVSKRQTNPPTIGATPEQISTSGIIGPYVSRLNSVIQDTSPLLRRGKQLYARESRDVVDPLLRSPVGSIARKEVGQGETVNSESLMKSQQSLLMPENAQATSPETIRKTVATLSAQDPEIMRKWTRQSLDGIFAKVNSDGNTYGGANFAKRLVGNSKDAENFKALIESTGGTKAYEGFKKLIDVFEAQGKRLPANSATAHNEQLIRRITGHGIGSLLTGPTRWAGEWHDQFKYGKDTWKISEMLTRDDAIKYMQQLADTEPNSAKAQALINAMLAGGNSGTNIQP